MVESPISLPNSPTISNYCSLETHWKSHTNIWTRSPPPFRCTPVSRSPRSRNRSPLGICTAVHSRGSRGSCSSSSLSSKLFSSRSATCVSQHPLWNRLKKFSSLTPVVTDPPILLTIVQCNGEHEPETGNTDADQIVQKVHKLRPDMLLALIQVVETHQFAVPHVWRVVVIVHRATSVEIFRGVGHLGIVEIVRVRPRISCPVCVVPIAGHVVHDNVHVDPHTRLVTSRYHVDELLSRARSSDPFVGNWLITFPPWPLVNHYVLLYWWYLYKYFDTMILSLICLNGTNLVSEQVSFEFILISEREREIRWDTRTDEFWIDNW